MQAIQADDGCTLILFQPERAFLSGILQVILHHYGQAPEELPPRVWEVWYSAETTASLEEEDRHCWMESLRDFRQGNAGLCRRYLKMLQEAVQEPFSLPIARADLDSFLIVINDHRLYQAAVHEVGEAEMEEDWSQIPDTGRRQALLEIHFLAVLLELLLRVG